MGAVRVNGSTSGYVELAAPAVAGSVVMTLPATTGTLAVQGAAYGRSETATVLTDETTTSASFTDLATAGPAVTVTTGTKALVIFTALQRNTVTDKYVEMAYAVSGATTVAASGDTSSFNVATAANRPSSRFSVAAILTGLTAGSNTFTAKYRANNGGTASFAQRNITVIDMGS